MFDEDSWLPYSRQGSQRHRASCHLKDQEEISKFQFRCSKHTKFENGSNIKVVIGNIDFFILLVCSNLFFAAHPSVPPGHNQSYVQSYVMMFYIHFLYIVHKHWRPDILVQWTPKVIRVEFNKIVVRNTDISKALLSLYVCYLWKKKKVVCYNQTQFFVSLTIRTKIRA